MRHIKKRNLRSKETIDQDKSMIGKIIDLPLEDFERELVEQKVNIGTINNLILNLESIYFELRLRKDSILDLVFKGVNSKEEGVVRAS